MAYRPINLGENNNGSRESLSSALKKIDAMFEEIYEAGVEGGEARVLYQGKIDARFRIGPRPVTNGPVQIRGLRLKK